MLGLSTGLVYPSPLTGILHTVTASRIGWIQGTSDGTFSTARETGDSGEVEDSVTTGSLQVQYYLTGGGRGNNHRFQRVYLYFDVSGISGVTGGKLYLHSVGGAAEDGIIALRSNAFGGDGGSALHVNDFYNSMSYSAAFTSEIVLNGLNDFEGTGLNSYAAGIINTTDHFIVVLVEHTHDYGDSAGTSVGGVESQVTIRTGGVDVFPYLRLNA